MEKPKLVIKLSHDDILQLLGDTPEVRIEISSSIVQRFTNSHLKGIVNHELVKEAETRLKAALKRQVEHLIGTWEKATGMSGQPRLHLTSAIEERIQQVAQTAVGHHIREIVQSELQKWDEKIESYVEASLKDSIRDRVGREVRARLEAGSKAALGR